MPDYKKSVIYKLFKIVDDKELCYIGSTTHFINRKHLHKIDSETKNSLLYKTIRQHGGIDTWEMVKIIDFPCDTKEQLRTEEDRYIKELGGNLNVNRAYVSKEEKKQIQREYYANNPEYRELKIKRIMDKYNNDEEFRKKSIETNCNYIKRRYKEDESFRKERIQKSSAWIKHKYATDEEYRNQMKEYSRNRYLNRITSKESI